MSQCAHPRGTPFVRRYVSRGLVSQPPRGPERDIAGRRRRGDREALPFVRARLTRDGAPPYVRILSP